VAPLRAPLTTCALRLSQTRHWDERPDSDPARNPPGTSFADILDMITKVPLGPAGSFTVTPSALAFMRRMIRFGGRGPKAGFRFVVSPGGCSGISSDFSIEVEPGEGDAAFTLDGLALFVPTATFDLLASVTVDFADTPTQAGLILFDPKPPSCSTDAAKAGLVQLQAGRDVAG
jgi:Fe-S cluster assembly iron-binding protein IscA